MLYFWGIAAHYEPVTIYFYQLLSRARTRPPILRRGKMSLCCFDGVFVDFGGEAPFLPVNIDTASVPTGKTAILSSQRWMRTNF